MWQGQVEGLADVADVIAPDLRGFGAGKKKIDHVLTMEDFATELRQELALRAVDRVVLCGLSMGGYVAMDFAARWPHRVQGMVLANTRANADDAEGVAAREGMAQDALTKGMAVIARGMVPKLIGRRSLAWKPGLQQSLREMIVLQRPEAVAAAARGMALRPDRFADLRRWTFPTLVITGDDDDLMPLPTSRAMADAVPGARLVVIPGAGHLSPMEQPDAFNTAMRAFLHGIADA